MRKTFILNNALRGYPKGYKFTLDVKKDGTPLDRYWANRFEDAKTDNCIEFFHEATPKVEKTEGISKEKIDGRPYKKKN